jgi:peptidoglycan/xylan/chitin deacetylase (PgdA/CDA1 family)
MRCQYEVALPVLDEMGIPAAFFVMAGPYLLKKIPLVHKIHWCRAHWGNGEILDFIERQAAQKEIAGRPSKVEMEEARRFKPYDDEESSRLKYFLSRVLPLKTADRIMDRFLEEKKVDLSRLRSDFFMGEEMIRNLGDREMLGSHAVMHVPLSMLDPEELSAELLRSRSYLESLCGRQIEALSYPYGIADSVSRAVAARAAAAGYKAAYTMERARNTSLEDPCLLARIDCRDIGRMGTLEDRSIFRPGRVHTG